jgi:hypothetical protein
LYWIQLRWESSERRRWEAFKEKQQVASATPARSIEGVPTAQTSGTSSKPSSATHEQPPYKPAEKEFLKKSYRDEFHFLQTVGLSIYKDEDRDEGRAILRSTMASDGSEEEVQTEEEQAPVAFTTHDLRTRLRRHYMSMYDKSAAKHRSGTEIPAYTLGELAQIRQRWGDENKFLQAFDLDIHKEEHRKEGRMILRGIIEYGLLESSSDEEDNEEDDEFDFTGHQADYAFTAEQLEWIEKSYRNSEEFMMSFGLKFYRDEDLEEAKAIAQSFMEDDEGVVD